MNFARNATGLLLTSGVGIPLAFLMNVVLARFLSVEDRGLYSLLTTFSLIAVILGQMGWPTATIYRLRRIGSAPRQVASTSLLAIFVISSVFVLACIALRPALTERFLGDTPAHLYYIAVAMIPLHLIALLLGSLSRGINRFIIQNAYKLSLDVGLLVVLGWVLIYRQGAITEAMVAVLALHVVCVGGYLGSVLRHTGLSTSFDWNETKQSVIFGLKSYVQMLAGQMHERIDIFMIAYFLRDTEQVAYYAIAVGLVSRIMILPASIAGAAFPQLAELGPKAGAEFIARVNRHTFFAVTSVALALAIIVPWFVPFVFGAPYEASVMPALVLLPGAAIFTIYRTLSRYFTAINRQQANIFTQVGSVVVNLTLNALWIPKYGILGAAMASMASYALEAILISIVFSRRTGISPHVYLLVSREDIVESWVRLSNAVKRVRSSH